MHCRGRIALVLLVGSIGVGGCTRPPDDPAPRADEAVLFDLVEALDLAEVDRQVAAIDLGTPAGRRHLGAGWSWDEAAGDGTTFAWATGDLSTLRFHLVADRPSLVVHARAWPLSFPGAPPQAVRWLLDGRDVARVDLPAGPSELRVDLGPVAAGRHRLDLEPAWHREVREVLGGDDPRSLSIAWDRLRFDGSDEPAGDVRADAATLVVPAGGEVSYFVAEPATRLVAEAVAFRGAETDGDGLLEVVVETDVDGASLVRRVDSPGSLSVALPPIDGPTRVGLRAVAGGRVVLRGARLLGPAPSTVAESTRAVDERPRRPLHVLLVVVDTLRVDRLGFYGHPRPTSPRLDALAERSIVFERAVAQSSWTKSTMASLLTGLGPLRHGIRGPEHGLGDDASTLAEILGAAGWWTAAASTNAHLTAESGFAQGFDRFETLFEEGANHADAVAERGLTWLDERPVDRPFFLWLHLMEPHAPYAPPSAERERFAASVDDPWIGSVEHVRALGNEATPNTEAVRRALLDLYDAEIAAADRAVGTLLDGLAARGLADDTLVVVVADHGEAFDERGAFGHGWDLHAEVLDVPLVLHVPGRGAARVEEPVQQVDLPPTLLDLLGVSAPESAWDGDSLVPRLDGVALPPRPLVAAMDYEGRAGLAVVHDRHKLILPRSVDFGPRRLYDRVDDPAEARDLLDDRPVLAGWLAALARRAERDAVARPETVDLDPETRRRLEALGYL